MVFIKPLFLLNEPILSVDELLRLANIADNAGQVVLGIMVLSPLLPGVDKRSFAMVFLGIILVIICWSFSLYFTRKANKL